MAEVEPKGIKIAEGRSLVYLYTRLDPEETNLQEGLIDLVNTRNSLGTGRLLDNKLEHLTEDEWVGQYNSADLELAWLSGDVEKINWIRTQERLSEGSISEFVRKREGE